MNKRRSFLAAAAAAPLLYPAVKYAGGSTAGEPVALPVDDGSRLPNVTLATHEGKRVRFYDDLVKDRLIVVNMMYASCSNLCPPNTANLLRVQERLRANMGRDVHMYSLTLQPELDRPRDLRAYMDKYGIGPGWTFLTGEPAHVELLRLRLGFFTLDPAADADLKQHTGMLRIGHDRRDRWSMIPAIASPDQIVKSITNYL